MSILRFLGEEDPTAALHLLLLAMLDSVELGHNGSVTNPELAMLMATTPIGRALGIVLAMPATFSPEDVVTTLAKVKAAGS